MALTILGGSGYQRGVEVGETGINCSSFVVRYFPKVNDKLEGIGGEPFLKVVSTKLSREVKIQGEVNAATGVMAYTHLTACVPANDVADFGDGSGTLLMDEAEVSQERGGWRNVNVSLSSDPLLVLS